jgi:ABC-type multidrug transport system fused ATPase/permease subunit
MSEGVGERVSMLEWALLCLHAVDTAVACGLALPLVDYDLAALFRVEPAFARATVDLMWLAVARLVVVPGAVLWRARRARRNRTESELGARRAVYDEDDDNDDNGADAGASINGDGELAPLLLLEEDDRKKAVQKARRQERQRLLSDRARKQIHFDRLVSRTTRSLHFTNHAILVVLFLFILACLVFVGIKAVMFQFAPRRSVLFYFEAVAMALSLVFMTVQLWLARDILDAASQDNGRLLPSLHLHGLFVDESIAAPRCDSCNERIRERVAYRCRMCDFDVCLQCFKQHSRKQTEDVLRGDGARDDLQLTNWRYVKRTITYMRPFWVYIAIALVLMCLRSASQIALPNFQGQILDRVIARDRDGFVTQLYYYTALSVSVTVLSSVQAFCFSLSSRHMARLLKNDLFSSIIVQDIAYFDATASGQLTSRLSGDVNAMISPVQSALASTVSSGFQLIGGLVMCISTSFRLSMLALTTIGPIVLIFRIYAQWSRGINKQIWASWSDANARATEALKNIRTVRAFSMEPKEIEGFERCTGEALRMGIKDAFAGMLTNLLGNVIDNGVSVLLLAYGSTIVLGSDDPNTNGGDTLTVGALITFQLYWNMINNAYNTITSVFTSFTQAGGAAQRVISLLDSLPDIDVHAGANVAADFRGDLELRNVNFTYQMRPEEPVLKGVNLRVHAGKTLALVGRSGGGKSTIIHLLMRFYDPTSGVVLVDGQDLRGLCALDYRRKVGVVTQETQLFRGSIAENIGYGAEGYTHDDLVAAAKLANAHEFIEATDDGYDTKVGENGVRLSGGQRQRIALARMLLRKPQVILLDEATSALDTESEALVQSAIDRMLVERRVTVVLVAHRLSTVVNADLIAVIDKGRIVEQGTHSSLLQLGGIYAKLVGKQLQKEANLIGADEKMRKSSITIDDLLDEDDPNRKAEADPDDIDSPLVRNSSKVADSRGDQNTYDSQ